METTGFLNAGIEFNCSFPSNFMTWFKINGIILLDTEHLVILSKLC